MSADFQLSTLLHFRQQLQEQLGDLPAQKWFEIPRGFNNHIAWQLGHLLVTPEILLYKNSGLPFHYPETLLAQCRKGSTPRGWAERPAPQFLLDELTSYVERLQQDLSEGKFERYQGYTTSAGVTLSSFDEALTYTLHHEGVHTATIRAYLRLLS